MVFIITIGFDNYFITLLSGIDYIKEKGLNSSTIVLYAKIITAGYLESDIGYSDPDTNLIKKSKLVAYSLALKSPYFYYLLRSWKERRL